MDKPADVPVLLLAAKPCSQCLTTRSRIVPAARASSIIRSCRRDGTHFVCHKAPPGQVVHCRGVHDALGRQRGAPLRARVWHPCPRD